MHGFIDCHCHISAGAFDEDTEGVIESARRAGLVALLAVAEHAGEFDKIMALSQRFPGFVFPCLGVHPVQEVSPEQHRSASLQVGFEGFFLCFPWRGAFPRVLHAGRGCSAARHREIQGAAGGYWGGSRHHYKEPWREANFHRIPVSSQVGLDFTPRYVKSESDKESQRQVLVRQSRLAKELDLPLNVHSRSAGRPTIQLLKQQGVEKVLLHAFDGKASVAMEAVEAGYFFSIPPSIIRSEQQKLVKRLPLESMCLETDSPALGPEKQVRNEPRNIRIAAEYISRVKGVSVEDVMEATTQNALRLFPKLKSAIQP